MELLRKADVAIGDGPVASQITVVTDADFNGVRGAYAQALIRIVRTVDQDLRRAGEL